MLLAQAFLTGICARQLSRVASPVDPDASPTIPPLPLTVPEVRHVLGRLLWPPRSLARLVLAWSWWRRCHRSRARFFPTKRRLEAG